MSKTFNTQKEGLDWIRKTRDQIDEGMNYASTKTTLGEFMNDWITSIKSAKRPSTWSHYEQLSRSYIIPKIGQIKLKDLRPEHIQCFYTELHKLGTGTYTILKTHAVLHSALEHATKLGIVYRNPARLVQPPKEPATEMKILDESQVSQLLVATIGHPWKHSSIWQLLQAHVKWSSLD